MVHHPLRPAFALILLSACATSPRPSEAVTREVGCMGTNLEITIHAESRRQALQASESVVRSIEASEQRLSTWIEHSELSSVNRGESADGLLATELQAAADWSLRTNGAFEPRAGALVHTWDLRGAGRFPSPAERKNAAADRSLWEEGGFGKGAALDQALAELAPHQVHQAVLNLGGQIAVQEGTTTTIQISHPLQRDRIVGEFSIDVGSVATSGNSERGLQVQGRRIGHLLDPRSGEPAADFGSVTVWAPSALAADCLSTALFVMGPDAAMNWAKQNPSIEVLILIVTPTGLQMRATPKLESRLHSSMTTTS